MWVARVPVCELYVVRSGPIHTDPICVVSAQAGLMPGINAQLNETCAYIEMSSRSRMCLIYDHSMNCTCCMCVYVSACWKGGAYIYGLAVR